MEYDNVLVHNHDLKTKVQACSPIQKQHILLSKVLLYILVVVFIIYYENYYGTLDASKKT